MTAPPAVGQLVDKFDTHWEAYRSGRYNEAQVREEFLNPFFEALGWDVYSRQGWSEAYKSRRVGRGTRATFCSSHLACVGLVPRPIIQLQRQITAVDRQATP